MQKLIVAGAAAVLCVGIYLVMLAIGAEESVHMVTGQTLPKGLVGMLGAVAVFGSIVVAAENVKKMRNSA